MMTRSGWSLRSSFSTCSSCREISRSGSRYAARVARPSGGKSEYLIGRQYGLVASVSAGRINFTLLNDRLAFRAGSSLAAQLQGSVGRERRDSPRELAIDLRRKLPDQEGNGERNE